MVETGVVIANGMPIYWHLPPGRSSGHLPDSRDLWNVLWENRHIIDGFAHSHPGGGIPQPSYTDLTTFKAIELGLGKNLNWWIISSEAITVWKKNEILMYYGEIVNDDPTWLAELRRLSYEINENS